jgi:hypothetical protein
MESGREKSGGTAKVNSVARRSAQPRENRKRNEITVEDSASGA